MKITVLSVLFATAILLTATIATSEIQYADALKGQGVGSSKYGSSTDICGVQICSEIPGGKAAYEQQQTPSVVIPKYGMEQKGLPLLPETVNEKRASGEICQCAGDCNCAADGTCTCSDEEGLCMCGSNCNCSADGTCTCGEGCSCGTDMKGCSCSQHAMTGYGMKHSMKTISGTMQSATDPGMGHEQHQLVVLLPPSDKMYKGILSYSASENVQLVALHGPLAEGEDMGQTIWTPDGDTKFALTLVNPEDKMGTWMFTGNALAVHTFNQDPFAITYTVNYATISDHSDISGACQCTSDCNCSADGTCSCSGQDGACMCGPNCTCGTDGTCTCGEGCSCGTGMHGTSGCNCSADGTCTCSGQDGTCMCGPNCSCGTDGTCSCGTSMHGMTGHKMKGHVMKAISRTMQSATDPGMGHEQHQLAVLLPPRDNSYTGLLTYSASENVQLVALHGPLAEGEDMGQTIWTPDGDTKFALTLVNPEDKMGTWMFTGNALAVHTFNQDPFAITYSIATMDSGHGMSGQKMMHGTSGCNCSEDRTCSCGEGCACGTENCNCSADGTCTCGEGCACGQ